MGRVMIKCPKTGKMIDTGMAMDEQSFRSSTLQNNQVGCPECGQTHTWDKDDAVVVSKED